MARNLILGLLAGAACISAPAHALTNGDFSAGLAGWSAQGIVTVTGGGAAALFSSITNENTDLSTAFLGGTYGSTLQQAVSLGAGMSLSFDWRFATSDSMPYNDFATLELSGSGGYLARTTLSNVSAVGSGGNSGWQHYTAVLPHSVTSIAFFVSNHTDNNQSSALYIDNVAAVPEPETYAMFLAGLGVLAAAQRRRTGGRG